MDDPTGHSTRAFVVQRGIAAPVQHDVMFVGNDGGQFHLIAAVQDDPRTLHGMLVHEPTLFVCQFSRLREDFDWNTHLADVMQQAGNADGPYLFRTVTQRLGQRHG